MSFFEDRKKARKNLDDSRIRYESHCWQEYNDADWLSILGPIEKLMSIVAIAKSKMALICPVEARSCYSFVFAYLSASIKRLCEFLDNKFLTIHQSNPQQSSQQSYTKLNRPPQERDTYDPGSSQLSKNK